MKHFYGLYLCLIGLYPLAVVQIPSLAVSVGAVDPRGRQMPLRYTMLSGRGAEPVRLPGVVRSRHSGQLGFVPCVGSASSPDSRICDSVLSTTSLIQRSPIVTSSPAPSGSVPFLIASSAGRPCPGVHNDLRHSRPSTTPSAVFSPSSCLSHTASSSSDAPVAPLPAFLIGHGYDIHRLSKEESRPLIISGVEVPCQLGPVAHSDGDVVYHSVCDAVFGSLGLPDIGQQFPDTDPKWKGQASNKFVEEARKQMAERGYQVGNLDVTLILERPKVKNLKDQMKGNLVELLKTHSNRVNLKARTHEQVDAVGEQRAMECHVVVLLERAMRGSVVG
eukprot:GHVQ01014184.1.p1 GENE.GHVQ01014184.1~~GHVQ01014184.1.p1  ORF type:complete len:333 (+),score=42.12 GHVQ01014184.1:513-1511(+)